MALTEIVRKTVVVLVSYLDFSHVLPMHHLRVHEVNLLLLKLFARLIQNVSHASKVSLVKFIQLTSLRLRLSSCLSIELIAPNLWIGGRTTERCGLRSAELKTITSCVYNNWVLVFL